MKSPISSRADVNVGDLVEVRRGRKAAQWTIGEVIAVADAAMTIKLKNKRKITSAYIREERITWTREVKRSPICYRLDARDRWQLSAPTTPDIRRTLSTEPEIAAVAIRDRPGDVADQIWTLSAWLKAKPEDGAP